MDVFEAIHARASVRSLKPCSVLVMDERASEYWKEL